MQPWRAEQVKAYHCSRREKCGPGFGGILVCKENEPQPYTQARCAAAGIASKCDRHGPIRSNTLAALVPRDPDIPALAAEFLLRYIESVEELEVLLLFYREPTRVRTGSETVTALRSSAGSIAQRLAHLMKQGLLRTEPGPAEPTYIYAPASPELNQAVESVASIYRERPVKVIEFIFAKPSQSVRGFSDAFKIRKNP